MHILKENGWEGTYRKCYCPKCAQLMKYKRLETHINKGDEISTF